MTAVGYVLDDDDVTVKPFCYPLPPFSLSALDLHRHFGQHLFSFEAICTTSDFMI